MSQEATAESGLHRLLKNVLERNGYIVEGMGFEDVRFQYPIDSGMADLVILLPDHKPLLLIECRRKLDVAGGSMVREDFNPLSSKMIGQALDYALQVGTLLFATTNGKVFALFTTPSRNESFSIDTNNLLVKDIQLREDSVEELLIFIVKWYKGMDLPKMPVDWIHIVRFKSFVDWLSPHTLAMVEYKLKSDEEFAAKFEEFKKKIKETTPGVLATEAVYILMNKIIFYKILERSYGLPKLEPISTSSGKKYIRLLNNFFTKASETVKGFKPVFFTGIYDVIPLPDDEYVLEEVNTFIEDMNNLRLQALWVLFIRQFKQSL